MKCVVNGCNEEVDELELYCKKHLREIGIPLFIEVMKGDKDAR